MRRFFWNGHINDGFAVLDGTEARHMSEVLRMCAGQEIILCDGLGNDFLAAVEHIDRKSVKLKLKDKISENFEPNLNATLFLAHTKGDRLDFAIQKAVEIGVRDIQLFRSSRCVASGGESKLARLNRIAFEAAKQSGRSYLTNVVDIGTFQNALELPKTGARLFCYEMSSTPIKGRVNENIVSIMCGPEGGFSQDEADLARECGWEQVSLGKRILRAETAPLVALSVLMFEAFDI